jgi:hypothetical protein
MKRIACIIGLFGIVCLPSCVSHNTCSSTDRIEMRQGGFSSEEIKSHCTSYKISDEFVKTAAQVIQSELTKNNQGGNQPAASAVQNSSQQHYHSASAASCATQYGQCPLMQPGTNGAPCVCYTMYGQIPGVMR